MESEQIWFSISVRDPFTHHSPEIIRRLSEISRLLHNFLAVAMSLKDHTNRVVDRVFTEDYFQVYENQVKSIFAGKPIPRFVQDLRNYSLHRKLPLAGSQTTLQNNGPITTIITLNKRQLLDWDGWGGVSKQYLKFSNEHISIQQFIDDYYNEAKSFHQWLDNYFFTTYAQAYAHQQKTETEAIKASIPQSLQEFYFRELAVRDSDILVDDNWTFELFE